MGTEIKDLLKVIYEDEKLETQFSRYDSLFKKINEKFGKQDYKLFSSPGRTEIGGNHTDHNHGKVIASSISLDSIAVASANSDNTVIIYSEGYKKPFLVDLNNSKPLEQERGTTSALIRGVASGFLQHGFNIGGFNAFITSNVSIGSGLSSSASIEVLIGTILNHFYNNDGASPTQVAMIGQYAENKYFGKPCGLMDQLAIAEGGIIYIDFKNQKKPLVKKINFDFNSTGYKLLVVDTEDDHADLTEDYAAIPIEMKKVAIHFKKEFCRDINLDELLSEIKSLRKKVSDRAILRAIHFLEENQRVDEMLNALNKNDFDKFLKLINQSGNSSFKYLQNIYSPKRIERQSVSLALALSEAFIKQRGAGACRVHGGGFAGTIQVFLPANLIEEYKNFISNCFNKDSIKVLSIRKHGAVCLNNFTQ